MANSWYVYNGFGNPFNSSSYHRIPSYFTPQCIDGFSACAVYIYEDNPTPIHPFSDNIVEYIANGYATLTRQPLGLSIKPFFYLKND